ncbi:MULTISPECIES: rhomboid family intramembrane serine protease [unclassified Streptomyces]|uniref:rhomboid family intramembrane serine protease n=1 Tax=Streptomyces sp. T21Q-yed TaxID=3018441 RepID=UPI0023655731|nr:MULTISPECIES: rhomboid family intramembrane serine protease [unclassified Streptomyces]MDF3141617.1 rhomboid family intramembrane serine protease [Streptomyces sp. T21Q-yed]WDF37378.1 rhomboid family intramembrane serine protease [Streptomyces sp. T12]
MESESTQSESAQSDSAKSESAQPTVTTCYRHPKVESHVRCTRCDRYICPDCMREAAVGHQCVECVKQGARSVRQARTVVGGRIAATPLVTSVLIGLNVLAYLAEVVRPEILDRFAMLSARLVGPDGGYYVYEPGHPSDFHAEGVVAGQWDRLLTSGFLHTPPTEGTFGLLHIVMNMLSLWQLGRVVEPMLGRVRYVALYLLATLGGSVFELLLTDAHVESVGASGAIFGLGAAYYVLARRVGADMRTVNRFMTFLLLWLLLSAGLTSWQGHLGGLLTGAAVTLAYAYAPRGPRQALIQAAASVGVLVLLAAVALARVSELTG